MTRIAGLVGGLGPESTIDYYRRILDAWAARHPGTAPTLAIDSLDVQHGLRLVATDRPALVEYLLSSVERLARAGATFVAITANTPHIAFDAVAERASVPLVSIVEVCAAEARRLGVRRVLLLGTQFTMSDAFYPDVFARAGVDVVVPDPDAQAWLHARYMTELLRGDFRDETRAGVVSLIERMRHAHAIDAVVLGGTELPLLLGDPTVAGLPILDTTALHVAAIVERLDSGDASAPAPDLTPTIAALEARLRAAQLNADVAALDALISDDLLFTGPDGALGTKAEDLAAHGSGAVRFREHEPEELRVRAVRPDVAIAALRARLAVEVAGALVRGTFRYTRVWAREADGAWRVVGGHVSAVAES